MARLSDFAACHYSVWVVENFVLYPWAAGGQAFSTMVAPKVIGMLELAVFEWNRILTPDDDPPTKIVYQFAANAKQFVTDHRLKTVGWLDHCTDKHARDAARHAFYYMARMRGKK